jgi:hypothetical protein
MTNYYTGVGSRETPPNVLDEMRLLAQALARAGWVLRSGGADGADSAFESGARDVSGPAEIFLPWKGFNNNLSDRFGVTETALTLASKVHPAWDRLGQGPKKLHARNCYQVLGENLDQPSALLICWTPDGCETERSRSIRTGGTGTAIALATRHGVPVFNLSVPESKRRLAELLGNYNVRSPLNHESLREQVDLF